MIFIVAGSSLVTDRDSSPTVRWHRALWARPSLVLASCLMASRRGEYCRRDKDMCNTCPILGDRLTDAESMMDAQQRSSMVDECSCAAAVARLDGGHLEAKSQKSAGDSSAYKVSS